MYEELVKSTLKNVGGSENIIEATHCMTRLRLQIADESKVQKTALEKIKGVLGVVKKGNQIQIVIGPDVSNVYKEFVKTAGIGDNHRNKQELNKSKDGVFTRILNTIAGIFNPIVPALAGAGLIKAILAMLVAVKLLSGDSPTYTVLTTISDGVFTYLPFLLAFSCARIFGMNSYVALGIAGAMLHPTFSSMIAEGVSKIDFLHIPMSLIKYNGSVLPIVLTIWFASYVEKLLDKGTPKALKIIVVPAFTILIAAPVALLLIGPLGQVLGNYIAGGVSVLFEKGGIFAGLIYGAIYSTMVVTGLHHGMVPVLVDSLSRSGFNYISPASGSANMAEAGASFGVWLKSKNKNTKTVAASATISALSGVTEPAIYGVNLRLKRPFFCAAFGGMVGGSIAGFLKAKAYAMGGPSFLTLPMFIGDPGNVFYVALAFSVAFIVAAIATYIVGFKDDPAEEAALEKAS
ncbi:PTS transporter subunit EIIC [Neobacillus sp. Marseille-QA0830]